MRLKSAVSAAKTRSRLRAELAVVKDEYARALAAWREVEELQAPAPELLEEIPDLHGVRQVWGMADANVWTLGGRCFDAERRQSLLNSWRSRRYAEHGFKLAPYSYKQRVEDLTDRLKKIERKLSTLMF